MWWATQFAARSEAGQFHSGTVPLAVFADIDLESAHVPSLSFATQPITPSVSAIGNTSIAADPGGVNGHFIFGLGAEDRLGADDDHFSQARNLAGGQIARLSWSRQTG
jgi:hypothetical protein